MQIGYSYSTESMKSYRMFKSPCKVNENIDNKIASKFEIALSTTIMSTIG